MGIFDEWRAADTDGRICSVTTGVVKNNWDKEHPGMVQVEYLLGTKGKNVTGWIPVAVPYAYKGCGLYALPEIGSEVVIAFNLGDRNCPIVIGSLWNKKNGLPEDTAVEKNTVKRFRMKGGCELVFAGEEGKETVEVHTPSGLMLCIEDENQTAMLADREKKNALLIGAKDGTVALHAQQKITFTIGGKEMMAFDAEAGSFTVKADRINGEASGGCTVKAQNVALEGTQLEITGKSRLSAQSDGITQIKGATVQMN